MTRVQEVGERIESLLGRLRSLGGGPSAAAEELTGLLVELYGDGLSHVVAALRAEGAAGAAILGRLADDDPLVESLLLLHGLHPLDVDARIQRTLDRVRPYLGSHAGGIQYLGVTDGVARLRLEGSCHGCPSSAVTVQLAIEGAVKDAAPEVDEVVVEGMTAPPSPQLLQIGPRPGAAGGGDEPAGAAIGASTPAAAAGGPGEWVNLPDLGPPSSRPVIVTAAGLQVLICAVRGTLYAYRDRCAACGSSLGAGRLERGELACECGARYDVCRAGAGLDDPGLHLDPLPLLSDSQGVRVAVPVAVSS